MTKATIPTVNPLEIVDIRLVLADLLSLHALSACARVSKDWNRSFMPSLWKHISLRVDAGKAPPSFDPATTLELAIKQKEFIQGLTIQDINEWNIRQRTELWSAIAEFPILRSLGLQQIGVRPISIKPESIQLLKPKFSSLNCLDFRPRITMESESYEEILSGCEAELSRPRSWPRDGLGCAPCCAIGRFVWTLGPQTIIVGKSLVQLVDHQVRLLHHQWKQRLSGKLKRCTRRCVANSLKGCERMSLLIELESVDFRLEILSVISAPLRIDRNDSSLEGLLRCPRLKEFMYDWDESDSETYNWIRAHWKELQVNSFTYSEDEYEYEGEYEDDDDFDEYGYGYGNREPTLYDQIRLSQRYDSEDSEEYNLRTYDYW